MSSSDSQHQHKTSITSAVPGYYVKLRDRIVPASASSLCDLMTRSEAAGDCLAQSQQTLTRWRRYDSARYVSAVTADSLASGPFQDFLAKKDCPKAQSLLSFWRDAQVRDSASVTCENLYSPQMVELRNNK